MSTNLVINPCLDVYKVPNVDREFVLIAPVPGKGRHAFKVRHAEFPVAYDAIEKFSTIGFGMMDPESDIDTKSRELFLNLGVLIEKEFAPFRPLFSCQLEDVPSKVIPAGSPLRVNDSFRFEPIDFARFSEMMYEKLLLPTQAIVWITNPHTGIEVGYWLSAEQADKVGQLKAGTELEGVEADDEIIQKMYAAGIVCTEADLQKEKEKWSAKIRKASSLFDKNGYAVIEGLLPEIQIEALRKFYFDYVRQGFMIKGDNQVEKRYWQQNEPNARALNLGIVHLMNSISGEIVLPSYCYAASYYEGATLRPHVDREQCEFSVSLQVDFQPDEFGGVSPWGLGVFTPADDLAGRVNFDWEEIEGARQLEGQKTNITLRNGDGLFYKGRELIHYRRELGAGCTSTSIFLHYVREDFTGQLT